MFTLFPEISGKKRHLDFVWHYLQHDIRHRTASTETLALLNFPEIPTSADDHQKIMAQVGHQHVLLIGIEFVQPLFSGNGILAQGLVQGLLTQSHNYHITVLCARPTSRKNEPIEIKAKNDDIDDGGCGVKSHASEEDVFSTATKEGRLNILVCDVPDDTWRRLDRTSCWNTISEQAPYLLRPFLLKHNLQFDFVFAIDWSALPTVYNLQESQILSTTAKLVYFVFRVFSASKELCESQNDHQFYRDNETKGMEMADVTILLSHVDQKALFKDDNHANNTHILVPPLRHDIHCQATMKSTFALNRQHNIKLSSEISIKPRYIICNARLSPEKNAVKFAEIMKKLHEKQILTKMNLTPLLIGAICDKEYAENVCTLLPSQSIVVNRFITSHELGQYLQHSVLNVHPSVYDAYGMTVIEAAAFGVPSIIHKESIGASSLLREKFGEVIFGNMASDSEDSYKYVESVLVEDGHQRLQEVGKNARARALSWSVNDYADELHEKLHLASTR